MKSNDLIMFIDEGLYAKWFFGRIGRAETIRYAADGKLHCRVRWMQPVKYHGQMVEISHFPASHFEIISEKK